MTGEASRMATWVGYPKSYSSGRNRPVQYVVIHATHGSEGPTSAEDGHAYDLRRTDGTSTHIFVDSNSAVREVPDADRAHHARYHGNEIGLGVEICGRADQTAAQWDDPVSRATLVITAREVAQMCRDHQIPVRRLSVAECRAAYYNPEGQRPKGIVGHVDVTKAYPEDNGTHWDPGPGFPWTRFLGMIAEEMGDNMPTVDEIADGVWTKQYPDWVAETDGSRPARTMAQLVLYARRDAHLAHAEVTALRLAVEAGASPDTAGLLAALDERLATLRADVEADHRDAIADLGEGGAAAVRADD